MANKKIVTPVYRLSYAHLVEPRAIEEGGELKYSVSILIPKSDKEFINKFNADVKKMMEDNDEKLKKGKNPVRHPLGDGDTSDKPEYQGHFYINASSKDSPLLVDKDRNEILNTREIYSGMYGKVCFNMFAYNTAGNRGIGCGLNSVQKVKNGEPLGGTYTMDQAQQDFSDESGSGGDDDLL